MAEAPQDAHDEHKENGTLEVKSEAEAVVDSSTKINGTNAVPNGTTTTHDKHQRDPDAQDMVISSLRSQIQDLFTQVTELNGKLVKSYDRVSDLEDDLHMASATVRSTSLKVSQLELERTQHLSALDTGLLVEKSHVTSELNRLMEKATEEAAQRGQAETARRDIEKDLDDLSATLFGQANTMVAEARYAKYLSEQKLADAESALKGAEEAVGVMQQQMQAFQAEKEEAERKAEEALVAMGKGKHKERRGSNNLTRSIRLLSSHLPYQEFMLFVAHLRSVHPSSPQPPAMTTLLPLPFLARLLNEDSEPTVRLDLAPSLNWLSRRSVLSAVHNGQLIIEPMSSAALLQESSVPGSSNSSSTISCALCGTPIFPTQEPSHSHPRPQPPVLGHSNSNSMSWSASLFKKPSHSTSYSISSNNSQPPTPPPRSQTFQQTLPPQIYIFRLASPASNTSSLPISSLPMNRTTTSNASTSASSHQADYTSNTSSPTTQSSTIYPLCTNNWCLSRLRTTCTLWAFVRTGIVEKVWEEEVPTLLPATISTSPTGEKPPIPPRRRGIWGMASALSERATSWGEGDKDKAKKAAQTPPPPPPEPKPVERRRMPPPPASTRTAAPVPAKHAVPPPLPKRSEVRQPTDKPLPETTLAPAPAMESAASSKEQPTLPLRPPRRPIAPASVPLPESRPHTPVASPIPPSITPAAGAAAPDSPVPPPLPRRAAGRAPRTLADGGSRPVTPVISATEPIAEPKDEGGGSKVEETMKVEGDAKADGDQKVSPTTDGAGQEGSAETPAPSAGSEALAPALAAAAEEKPESGSALTTPANESEVFVDAETTLDPVAEEKENKEASADADSKPVQKVEEKEKAEDVPSATDPGVNGADAKPSGKIEDTNEEAVKGDEKKVEEKEATVEEPTPMSPEDEKEKSVVVAKNVKSNDDDDETKADDEKEAYVGDATWEERTWKEIIRLREEMFWARVGGLRQE
ncbi:proline-rich protein [Lyophyllum atratum]|nr:proline-rich protein [Lyophyllum atratum]